MKRRTFVKYISAGGALAATGLTPLNIFSKEDVVKITILHTNDTHSRIEPFKKSNKYNAGKGGMVRRAELVKSVRKSNKNVLLFDAGDIYQGTPYFNMFKGEVSFKLMSKIGYDASTLGNHEFDNGIDGIDSQLKHMNFPFISSNYDFTGTKLDGKVEKYKIFEKQGIKIGVFGLGIKLEGLVLSDNYETTKYLDPIKTAQKYTQFLKHDKGCHIVVCLSHLGLKYEKEDLVSDVNVAEKTNDLDLIIGGHTHTFLDKPVVVKNPAGKEVLINQVGYAGINLGCIDFYMSKSTGKVVNTAAAVMF